MCQRSRAWPGSSTGWPSSSKAPVRLFTPLAGGIHFHDLGHVWGWHALLRLRDEAFVQGLVFGYGSVIEDNADLTAGILRAKAGRDARWPRMT